MDGIDDDEEDEDKDEEENYGKEGYGTGDPVPKVNYGKGSNKKVKIKEEKTWGATGTGTSHSSQQLYPPRTINVADTTADSQLSSSIPGLHSIIDMSMTDIEATSHISLVKTCVKKLMFSYWKFYDKNNDNQYSKDEGTMCGFIIKHTGIDSRKCNKD